jgi:hypothetical protein
VGCENHLSPGIFIIVVLMEALLMSSFMYHILWKCKLSYFLLLKPCLPLWMLLIMNALPWTLLPMYTNTQKMQWQLIQGNACGSCACVFAKCSEKFSSLFEWHLVFMNIPRGRILYLLILILVCFEKKLKKITLWHQLWGTCSCIHHVVELVGVRKFMTT